MQDFIYTLVIVFGPIILFVAVAALIYAPDLVLRTPYALKTAFWTMGALLVMAALYLTPLDMMGWMLLILGLVMVVEPGLAYLLGRATHVVPVTLDRQ